MFHKVFSIVLLMSLSFISFIINAQPTFNFNNYAAQANALVKQMTLDEKIGQMTLPSIRFLAHDGGLQLISQYHLGGVLVDGGQQLDNGKPVVTLTDWQVLAKHINSYPVIVGNKATTIPLLLGTDSVHGNQHVVNAVIFPHNIGLGATHDASLVQQIGAWTAYDVKDSGFNWGYAPTVAVAHDYRWGRTYESFSRDPQWVRTLGQAYIEGAQAIQGQYLYGMLTTAKHYIGDGDTTLGMDEGNVVVADKQEFLQENYPGYQGAIDVHVGSMMVSYSSINGTPMTINSEYLGDLRHSSPQDFDLFLVSDYEAVSRVAKNKQIPFATALAQSVNSGLDVFMISQDDPQYYQTIGDFQRILKQDVLSGLISQQRIDEAVRRILEVKLAMGLINATAPLQMNKPSDDETQVALSAAQESLVLLKNNHVLPYSANNIKHVIFLGDAYDDIGKQCGGWTISWQGLEGNTYWTGTYADSKASSIKTAVQAILGNNADYFANPNQTVIEQNIQDGNFTAQNTLVVATISEFPYAEFMGDVDNNNPLYDPSQNPYAPQTELPNLIMNYDQNTLAQIDLLKQNNIPVVSILFSGRPTIITQDAQGIDSSQAPLNISDAFIAAWLPGTTGGAAIANALFGNYHFGQKNLENTLPFAWPKNMTQVGSLTCGQNDPNNQPLFNCLYGLTD